MRSCLLLVFLIGFLCENALAQKQGQELVDSLLLQLNTAPDDSTRCEVLTTISDTYSYFDPAQGVMYGLQAVEVARKTGSARLLSNSYSILGINYDNQADFDKATETYFEALKWGETAGDKHRQAANLSNIATIFAKDKRDEQTEEYLNRAIALNKEINNLAFLSINYLNLGSLYDSQGKLKQAEEKYSESLALARQNEDNGITALAMANLAGIYAKEKNYPAALKDFLEAHTIIKTTADPYMEAVLTVLIGTLYATYVRDTAISITLPINQKEAAQKAIEWLLKGRDMCQEVGILDQQMLAEEKLHDMYDFSGNYQKALTHHRQYAILKDSVFNTETKMKIAGLEAQRELDIRQKQIEIDRLAVEKKRNERAYFLAGIVLLLLIIAGIIRSFLLQKKNNRLLSREKTRSDELLLNILPAETAEELKTHGYAKAKRFERVTVLFTDFKNFTQFAAGMTPEELVAEIDYCFKAFDRIVEEYGLEKIKTIGDAYMAAGGLPQANDSNPRDTVAAALAMRDFIHTYKLQREADSKLFLDVRIGAHSGPVVAGIVGSKKFAYDLWGDTVNTAARMESSGEAGQVNISGITYELVKDVFHCTYRGKIEAKNKGELDMYFVQERLAEG